MLNYSSLTRLIPLLALAERGGLEEKFDARANVSLACNCVAGIVRHSQYTVKLNNASSIACHHSVLLKKFHEVLNET